MQAEPKAIEGYLADLGLSRLSDREKREIAQAVLDARVRGIGIVLHEMGAFKCGRGE